MKWKNIDRILFVALTLIIGALIMLFSFGCSSTKEVLKMRTVVDSTVINEKSDSIRLLTIENEKLTSEKRELEFGVIRFDTVFVGDTISNTVTIHDGVIEAKGHIVSAVLTKSVLTKIVNEKNRVIDSLSLVKNKVLNHYYKVTEIKEKKVKRSFLNFWWLLAIGFIGGLYVGVKKHRFFTLK
jgi:hypothetical protein